MAQRGNPSNPGQQCTDSQYYSKQRNDLPATVKGCDASSTNYNNPKQQSTISKDYSQQKRDLPATVKGCDASSTNYNNPKQQSTNSKDYSQQKKDVPARTVKGCDASSNNYINPRQGCARPPSLFASSLPSRQPQPGVTSHTGYSQPQSLPSRQPQPGVTSHTGYSQPQNANIMHVSSGHGNIIKNVFNNNRQEENITEVPPQPKTMSSQRTRRQPPRSSTDQAGHNPQSTQQILVQLGEESLSDSNLDHAAAPQATKSVIFSANIINVSSGRGNNIKNVFINNRQEENITEVPPQPKSLPSRQPQPGVTSHTGYSQPQSLPLRQPQPGVTSHTGYSQPQSANIMHVSSGRGNNIKNIFNNNRQEENITEVPPHPK